VVVASAGPYASLYLAPDRKPHEQPTTLFFTGRMPFLPPNQQRQSIEGKSSIRYIKGKDSPYSIAERRVPGLIQVLGSQPAGDVSNKPGGRPPLLSAMPAVKLATLKMAATMQFRCLVNRGTMGVNRYIAYNK